ncbi:S-layer protein [Cohnella silvisoli]|uniref:S-layer protein n=1 Tax=Cohnella silvisoli TaxID=2873699 RepID=A0ABV1L1Z0_9BACL|nr:S-layer protein [Cohnella silvisoli]MCD9025216.1 S-layer protein [Cohnella silvisoli]
MTHKLKLLTILSLSLSILSQGLPTSAKEADSKNKPETAGKWLKGEYHAHTFQSDDAQQSLKSVLDNAFNKYGMDWMAVSDHLRTSSRDDEGNTIPGGSIPLSQGIIDYQAPKIKQLQDAGNYKNKIIFTGFEWDMPTYEHVGVGILTDKLGTAEGLKVSNQFEYLFTNRDEKMFDPADVAVWNAKDSRAFSTREDARTALSWLEKNYAKTSYAILNHPSRKRVYTIADFRDFNNIAPDVAFGFEGMPGNQMEPDRGGLNLSTPENRTYGGSDYMLAKLGGAWDALLGEGRRFWNFSNSDSHFEISENRLYSSGYWPGEYSKNYTWVQGADMQAVLDGMRSGKSFSVFGDLINALDFSAEKGNRKAEMGENLQVKNKDMLKLTIRFKSSNKNNNGDPVKVDHVDLISGDVTGKITPGTDAYSKSTNDTTKVVKRFTAKDWKMDSQGFYVINYSVKASRDQYFRLRGTNLGVTVEGETLNGEPLMDTKTDIADNETRFTEINKRNYKDLWFYSNPIFVSVSDEKPDKDNH